MSREILPNEQPESEHELSGETLWLALWAPLEDTTGFRTTEIEPERRQGDPSPPPRPRPDTATYRARIQSATNHPLFQAIIRRRAMEGSAAGAPAPADSPEARRLLHFPEAGSAQTELAAVRQTILRATRDDDREAVYDLAERFASLAIRPEVFFPYELERLRASLIRYGQPMDPDDQEAVLLQTAPASEGPDPLSLLDYLQNGNGRTLLRAAAREAVVERLEARYDTGDDDYADGLANGLERRFGLPPEDRRKHLVPSLLKAKFINERFLICLDRETFTIAEKAELREWVRQTYIGMGVVFDQNGDLLKRLFEQLRQKLGCTQEDLRALVKNTVRQTIASSSTLESARREASAPIRALDPKTSGLEIDEKLLEAYRDWTEDPASTRYSDMRQGFLAVLRAASPSQKELVFTRERLRPLLAAFLEKAPWLWLEENNWGAIALLAEQYGIGHETLRACARKSARLALAGHVQLGDAEREAAAAAAAGRRPRSYFPAFWETALGITPADLREAGLAYVRETLVASGQEDTPIPYGLCQALDLRPEIARRAETWFMVAARAGRPLAALSVAACAGWDEERIGFEALEVLQRSIGDRPPSGEALERLVPTLELFLDWQQEDRRGTACSADLTDVRSIHEVPIWTNLLRATAELAERPSGPFNAWRVLRAAAPAILRVSSQVSSYELQDAVVRAWTAIIPRLAGEGDVALLHDFLEPSRMAPLPPKNRLGTLAETAGFTLHDLIVHPLRMDFDRLAKECRPAVLDRLSLLEYAHPFAKKTKDLLRHNGFLPWD